jgi:hypothetical protein
MVTLGTAGAASDVVVYVSTNKPVNSAELVASSIFKGAGISVEWRRRAPASEPAGAVAIHVTLSEDPSPDTPPDTLAVSYPYAGTDKGITVFYKRLREIAGSAIPEQTLLGHVLAHEIGHVLECLDSHSPEGVMKARWNHKDFTRMQDAPLSFSREDMDFLHNGLEARRKGTLRSFVP